MADKRPSSSTDVLICGAGPTGLMLANLLARQKISFRLIEKDSMGHRESRAVAIQARSMELFQRLGFVDRFLEKGLRGEGLSLFVKGQPVAQLNFADIGRSDTPYPYIFFLSQSVTETILEDELGDYGVRVERMTSLEDFQQTESSVEATLRKSDGTTETVQAKYLIGCDGARSDVRKSAGLSFGGGTYDAEFMLADAKPHWDLPPNRFLVLFGEKNISAILPLKGSELSRVVTIGNNKAGTSQAEQKLETKSSATIEEVQAVLQEASHRDVTLTDPQWVTRYRVHHRCVEQMSLGRMFLVGDSAHIHSPVGGQGMNTGLQDAENLAWKLARVLRNEASPELLKTYHLERWPVAQKLLNFTDRLFMIASSSSVFARTFRNSVVPLIGNTILRRRWARQFLFGFISQLNIRYHTNAAVFEDLRGPSRHKTVHAGKRAPDAPLKTGESLLGLLKGYDFNVFVMTRQTISAPERENFQLAWQKKNILGSGKSAVHWLDESNANAALQTYRVDQVLVSLIRPDGYIGFQSDWI